MKTTVLSLTLACAALVILRPAAAAPAAAGAGHTTAGPVALSAPESPAAAFARMLAASAPSVAAPAAPAQADPLLPYFNAALWSAPQPRRVTVAARVQLAGTAP